MERNRQQPQTITFTVAAGMDGILRVESLTRERQAGRGNILPVIRMSGFNDDIRARIMLTAGDFHGFI